MGCGPKTVKIGSMIARSTTCPRPVASQGFDRLSHACYVCGTASSIGEGVSDGQVRHRRAGRPRCSAGPGTGSGGHRRQGRTHLGGGGGVLLERCRRSHRRRENARAPRRGRRPLPPGHLPQPYRGYPERDALVARGWRHEHHQLVQNREPLSRKSGPYAEIFPEILEATEGHSRVDYGYHLAPMVREQVGEIERLVAEEGVTSFKYYMF